MSETQPMSSITLATVLYLDNYYGWIYFIKDMDYIIQQK